jgi:hypothetical protein
MSQLIARLQISFSFQINKCKKQEGVQRKSYKGKKKTYVVPARNAFFTYTNRKIQL